MFSEPDEGASFEQTVKRLNTLAEQVYAQDIERLMACQNVIDACLKEHGEDMEVVTFKLYAALKNDFPEVIARINEIVDDHRRQGDIA